MTAASTPPAQNPADTPLNSRAVVALTGMSYLLVGWSFSYLDRRYGYFGVEGTLWLVWALLGFGAGTLHARKPGNAGKTQWTVLGWLGVVLALFPGLAMFNLLRWTSLALMIVLGARAAVLKTRRDFYLTLTVIFVVSFMVGTHGNADWTLWFYLGPAWVFGGLALAWEHAAGTPLSRWTKALMALGFIGLSLLLAVLLFFFAPRPAVLGFGFLPPGTDTPGLFQQPAGDSGGTRGQGTGGSSAAASGAEPGNATSAGGLAGRWERMLQNMREAAGDRFIPQWQRHLMHRLIGWAESLLGAATGHTVDTGGTLEQETSSTGTLRINWLVLVAMLLVNCLLWRNRYRVGLTLVLGWSWALASHFPQQSMRASAQALKWCLHGQGHYRKAGQSVREHWMDAAGVAPLAKRWLGYAVDAYCAMRFGGVAATRHDALRMHQAVQGACDIMLGRAPELARPD